MKSLDKLTNQEKLELLQQIEEDEERFFQDYSDELEILIKDRDEQIRSKAVLCLWDYPTPCFLKILIDISKNDKSEIVRSKSIITLGRYIYEGCMDGYDLALNQEIDAEQVTEDDFKLTRKFLLEVYKNQNKSINERRHSLEALSFINDEDIKDLIKQAYNSTEKVMKQSAIYSMGRNSNDNNEWDALLLKELSNPDKDIQIQAVRAVGESKLEKSGPNIIELTYSDDKSLKVESIWALGQIGWKNAFDRLYELSESDDPEIHRVADEAIDEWHSNTENYIEDDHIE